MPARLLTHDEALALLRERVREAGTSYAWARQTGCDRATVDHVLHGDRLMPPAIALALGLRTLRMFEVGEGGG